MKIIKVPEKMINVGDLIDIDGKNNYRLICLSIDKKYQLLDLETCTVTHVYNDLRDIRSNHYTFTRVCEADKMEVLI